MSHHQESLSTGLPLHSSFQDASICDSPYDSLCDDINQMVLASTQNDNCITAQDHLKGNHTHPGAIIPNSQHEMNSEELCQNSAANYRDEWERLFLAKDYTNNIRQYGIKGKLRSSRFRSICWKVYLECLPEEPCEWVKATWESRQKYDSIQTKLSTNPRADTLMSDPCLNNPLSQEENSPWNQFFQDSELKITIKQDVIRTFPEIEFFHTPEIQNMMVSILFCYAREFPNLAYRQGMHELLAPIIFVLHSDQQAYLHASEIQTVRNDIKVLLDPEYTEHDAFCLFCQVMEAVEPWYIMNDTNCFKSTDQFNMAPFSRPLDSGPCSVIGVKLTKIYEHLLRRHDCELYNHLENMEIAPQIFGIRWLRLLFGREFSMQDLLVVWDAIFADSLSFGLVDYVFTSMLSFIRELLLNGDYTTCLSYLMRYPSITDVHYIIELAQHFRDPMKHQKPRSSTQPLPGVQLVGGHHTLHHTPTRNDSSMNSKASMSGGKQHAGGSTSTGLAKRRNSRPKTLALPSVLTPSKGQSKGKSSSEPSTLDSPLADITDPSVRAYGSYQAQDTSAVTEVPCHQHVRCPSDSVTFGVSGSARQAVPSGKSGKGPLSLVDWRLQKSGLSQSLGHLDKDSNSECMSREMVVLTSRRAAQMPPGVQKVDQNVNQRWSGKPNNTKSDEELEEELQSLRSQVSELQAMSEYCWQRMTRHLDHLQDCMVHQKLQHEDDMLLALAGLKRVRDILKGTLRFFEEVAEDEDANNGYCSGRIANRGPSMVRNLNGDRSQENGPGLNPLYLVAPRLDAERSVGQRDQDASKDAVSKDGTNFGTSLAAAKRELRRFFRDTRTTMDKSDTENGRSERKLDGTATGHSGCIEG